MESNVTLPSSKEPTGGPCPHSFFCFLSCKGNVVPVYAMKAYEGVEVHLQRFVSMALVGCEHPVLYIISVHVDTHTHTTFCFIIIYKSLGMNMMGFWELNI
jgi:hypothetical protein